MPHQVVDSGLDETSCFFIDQDGQEVTHGHYYEELGLTPSSISSYVWSSTYYTSTFASWLSTSSSTTTSSPTPSPSASTHSASPTSSPSSSFYVSTGSSPTSSSGFPDGVLEIFEGGDFSFYPDRRKVRDQSHAYVRLYGSGFRGGGGAIFRRAVSLAYVDNACAGCLGKWRFFKGRLALARFW